MTMHESEARPAVPPAVPDAMSIAIPRPVRDEFDALADAHRREILGMLGEGDRSVNELAARLPISRPAVSRHLKLLGDAGLVADTHAGTRHIFRLRPEGARAVQDYLERVWGGARPQPIADSATGAGAGTDVDG